MMIPWLVHIQLYHPHVPFINENTMIVNAQKYFGYDAISAACDQRHAAPEPPLSGEGWERLTL